jgi:adenylate cyclase
VAKGTQRRLTTIVAADIAGYSRLVGADEEGTLAALQGHRDELINELIGQYGGRVANTAGDSILMEFPSTVDAVRCAISIQQGMEARNTDVSPEGRIEFRIGINVGDVIVQGDDLLGDGVNIAARLEGLAEPGGIALSSNAHEYIDGKVKSGFTDGGEHAVKNIARPVRIWRWRRNGDDELSIPTTTEAPLPLPDKPSIAVLPFDNMSGDPEQEFFADGIAEDVITALSRFRSLFVIARNSSFSYKGTSPDIRTVASELGVRYVVEGSVRKAGNRVRITAQLIDAARAALVTAPDRIGLGSVAAPCTTSRHPPRPPRGPCARGQEVAARHG